MSTVRTCIFDLDGTLIDSRPGIAWAAEQAAQRAAPGARLVGLDSAIGARALQLFTQCLPEQPPDVIAAVIAEFRHVYDGEGWRMADVYDGVPELLRDLVRQGISLCIVTNKPALPTRQILEATGLAPLIDEAVSPDTADGGGDKKSALRALVERRAIDGPSAVYVGDTSEDHEAARHAGVRFVGVSYGYGAPALREAGLTLVASARELPGAITGRIDREVDANHAR